MKIAISGKGGSGKTTIVALLGYLFSQNSTIKGVFLIDADPDGNLGISVGFSHRQLSKLTPISELKEIIKQRTESNGYGFFKLNPEVSDIPERFSIAKDKIRLLVLGTIKKPLGGCYCPENAFLRSLLINLLVNRDEIVLLDMPAGIEHLTRGTTQAVDAILIVLEPTTKSIQTAVTIHKLATELKIKKIYFIGNKLLQPENDLKFIQETIRQVIKEREIVSTPIGFDSEKTFLESFIGYISFSSELVHAEQNLIPVYQASEKILSEVNKIKEKLCRLLSDSVAPEGTEKNYES